MVLMLITNGHREHTSEPSDAVEAKKQEFT